jgi:hypothetical protein
MKQDAGDPQSREWESLYERLLAVLRQFGTEDYRRTADCWVDDDNIGTRQQKVYVRSLKLLQPYVVQTMRALLSEFPKWEIVVSVSVPGVGDLWPVMGLTVREYEIVDGLQRQYFPPEFRGLHYEGARPGNDGD